MNRGQPFATLFGVLVLVLVAGSHAGCRADTPGHATTSAEPPPSAAKAAATPASTSAAGPPGERTVRGVRFVQVFLHGAGEESPLVVVLHGRGDRPEHMAGLLAGTSARMQVVLPQGLQPFGDGWKWFDWTPATTEGDLARGIQAAEDVVWPAVVDIAHGRKAFVGGFSQGAVLTFALAASHPHDIAFAFPMSGGCPADLLPRDHDRAAPLFATHGDEDRVIAVDWARTTVAAFRRSGNSAELREYPGVGHTVTAEMLAAVTERLESAIAAGGRD